MEHNSGSNRASNFKSTIDLKLRARGKIRAMHGQTKCLLVLYAKPSNKRFIIPLQKKLLFFGKSIQKYPDSVCENDVNNEQNVRA